MKKLQILTLVLAGYAAVISTPGILAQGRQLFFPRGTETAPGLAVDFTRSGFYYTDDSKLAITVNGRKTAEFAAPTVPDGTLGAYTGNLLLPDGSVSAPPLAFASAPTTGLRVSGTTLSFVTVENDRLQVNAGGVRVVPTGTVAAPALWFGSESTTGIRSGGVEALAFSAGGEDLGTWKVQRGTLTPTEVRTLNATPVEVIAAPAAGTAIEVDSIRYMLEFAAVAYDNVEAGEDLALIGANSSGVTVSRCDSVTCIGAAAVVDAFGAANGDNNNTFGYALVAAGAVDITILNGEWATTDDDSDGDSPIHYLIRYREVVLALDVP